MILEILQVSECPNAGVVAQRVRQAIADRRADIEIAHRVIDDADTAADAGMTGSPTLLVDGRDPFAAPGLVSSVSCRLYRTEDGGVDGAPTVAAIRTALGIATTAKPEPADGEPAAWRAKSRAEGCCAASSPTVTAPTPR